MTHSSAPDSDTRLVYSFTAIVAVIAAWLVFFVLVVLGAFTLMMVVVTAPVYAAAIVGYSGLLSSVHEYARNSARRVPITNARTKARARTSGSEAALASSVSS